MAAVKEPKFYFELDGHRYGGRFMTIRESAEAAMEIDQLTGGKFAEWLQGDHTAMIAVSIQAGVFMKRTICQWAVGVPEMDFLNSDDVERVLRYWEAYVKASDDFRRLGEDRGTGPALDGAASA